MGREHGFSLIELMVVVLIIGILVAIAVPIFALAEENTRTKACWGNQRMIEGAVESYRAANELMPPTINSLAPAFLARIPECPSSKLAYTLDASGTVYCDGAVGCSVHHHY
jgi:prepilin-type N-terminal cleavage/methylation domain-containing protein